MNVDYLLHFLFLKYFFHIFPISSSQNKVAWISPAKGRKRPPAFAVAKGGENMKDSYEQRVQNQFGGFCTKVLKNEANRIHNEYARQRKLEKSLDAVTPEELEQIAVMDQYFQDDHIFEVLGKQVVVTGDLLAEAIAKLPDRKRDIILLSYFLGMTDREISEYLNVVRQAVSSHRARILKELREILEKEGFEWPEV